MLLFWSPWFKYRFIKKEIFALILVVCLVAWLISSMSTPARARLNYGLGDAQNVCALTKAGTVLNDTLDETYIGPSPRNYMDHYPSRFKGAKSRYFELF